MISCLYCRNCSVLLWIFDLVCSVWHGRGVTSQSVDPDFDRQWCISQLEMVDQTWPNSQFFSPEILRSNSCDLARPVAISSGTLRTEAPGRCTLRLGAAAWRWSRRCWPRAPPLRRRLAKVPALRDGTDRTDVVGRRCHGFLDEIRWCSPP